MSGLGADRVLMLQLGQRSTRWGFRPLSNRSRRISSKASTCSAAPRVWGPATACRRGWALASAARSFGQVDGLVHLNPLSATFLDQVGAELPPLQRTVAVSR
jgi:hypothetical protein